MSDLHIEMVENLMTKLDRHLAEPMDVVEEYIMCADALERNDFNEFRALLNLLGFRIPKMEVAK